MVKKVSATERKSINSQFKVSLGTTSTPPNFKIKNRGNVILDEKQYQMIRKKIFCQSKEEDDNDCYINFHPSSIIGNESFDIAFEIPQVLIIYFE